MQKIVIACGVEIRDFQGSVLLDYLNTNADASKSSTWTYPKGAGAKARFLVEVVYTMAEFAKALEAADIYVIYEGHSRYGQGPAFGDAKMKHVPDAKAYPINPWGVHFRMGYDATDTECVGDLLEHSVLPAEYDLTNAPKGAFLPDALDSAAASAKAIETARKKGRLTKAQLKSQCSIAGSWRLLDTCEKALAATKTARGDEPLKGRHYYARIVSKPKDEFMTAVRVGSADLDKSTLACKVLFMASCSSHEHFFEPLDKRRKAVRSACKIYMTAHVCSTFNGRNFLKQVFKGLDPTAKKDIPKILKALNGDSDSGVIGIY